MKHSAAFLWLVCLAIGAVAPAAAQVTLVPLTDPLRLAAPVRPVKSGTAIYIVQLKDAGAASYKGGVPGFAPTKPGPGQRIDRSAGPVDSYVKHLEQTHDRLLTGVGAASGKIYSFRYALNGFAAELDAAQVSRLARQPEIYRIWLDTDQQLNTNNSPTFLGLENQTGGLRADLQLRGEDVVIGIIDSGIAPNHPSMADVIEHIPRACESQWARSSWLGRWLCHSVRHNPPTELVYDPPVDFRGACQVGEGFEASACNNKLIGARFYIDGFLFRHDLDPNEFRSPKDADGHGTHVATVAAGNSSVPARLFGTRIARISGIAPRARVAVYKACWLKPGDIRATCATSDLARAIDDAVADGVDILSYSLGSLETDLTAPDDMALLNALDAGVLTVVAAGNDGPSLDTIGSPSSAPWVLTVGASTQSGNVFHEAIDITAPEDLVDTIPAIEASFTPQLSDLEPIEEALVLVDDEQEELDDGSPGSRRDACETLANAAEIDGHIALIERGGCEFQVKLMRVEEAGAVGAVVYDNANAPIVMNGDAGSVNIPAVMIETPDGQALVDLLIDEEPIRVELAKGVFIELRQDGNLMAEFSSRGPPLSDRNFLKPDVTAPGVNILGGNTPDAANGLRGESFQYFSGTSQSAPEAAGVAALLKEAHPDWSPSTLKSALMTSAYQGVVIDDEDHSPANPFDMGAGHIDPNKAVEPGLVYDSAFSDHAAYLCGLVEPPFSDAECAALAQAGFPSDARDLNLPSIAIAELITGDAVTRRVTNVGPPASFTVAVRPPLDMEMFVEPSTLVLGTGQTAEFSVRFVDRSGSRDLWDFGELEWFDGTRSIVSPVAVQPVTMRPPPELRLSGASGEVIAPIAFGYDGEYFAGVHGLRAPVLDAATGQPPRAFVDDDPSNNFTLPPNISGAPGITAHGLNVPNNQLYLRISLFDELTDGNDDLDLYLLYCPTLDNCTQIAESGGFTSDEEINVILPEGGTYIALVHGFETDQVSGGPGANYSLFTWSFGEIDDVGNLAVTAPAAVADGDRLDLTVNWAGLGPSTRYLGAISHNTPADTYALTIVNIVTP